MNDKSSLLYASAFALVLAPVASAAPPATIELRGLVRDFLQSHVDFDVVPSNGYGHYAANVDKTVTAGGEPTCVGPGFKVFNQWRDADANPIAPHMYIANFTPGTIQVANSPSVHGNADVDTWDSSMGPYGGANIGPAPTFEVGAPMPAISAPAGLGPSVGNITLNGGTIAADGHYGSLTIDGDVVVSGQVTILCDAGFTMATHAKLTLDPGATLALYVAGSIVFMPHSNFNPHPDLGLPHHATIYNLGTDEMRISQPNGEVYAQVIAPNAKMRVMPNGVFYGNFIGQDLEIMANAAFHADAGAPLTMDLCGTVISDAAGGAGFTSMGGIDSPASFAQWYDDVAGVNMSMFHGITLVRQPSGVYTYEDDEFYPIDDALLGNEGLPHNNHFTYAVDAEFVYESCVGQYIEFEGADDFWLFIDGQLVIDLGGVDPGMLQRIALDRLALTDGATYTVKMYFAQRSGITSAFRLRTTIEKMWSPASFLVTAAYD